MAVGASIPLPDVPDKDIVAVYAKLVGELLCITINTVPEIMYALSALTRFMTRATSQHYGHAKQVLRYLKVVKHLMLTWCVETVKAPFQRGGQLSGFADASWADDKSSAHCAMFCAATTQLFHENQLSLLFSHSLQVSLSSSVWLPALKK
jgi:hypothetical protein